MLDLVQTKSVSDIIIQKLLLFNGFIVSITEAVDSLVERAIDEWSLSY